MHIHSKKILSKSVLFSCLAFLSYPETRVWASGIFLSEFASGALPLTANLQQVVREVSPKKASEVGINPFTYVRNNPARYVDPLGLLERERDERPDVFNRYAEPDPFNNRRGDWIDLTPRKEQDLYGALALARLAAKGELETQLRRADFWHGLDLSAIGDPYTMIKGGSGGSVSIEYGYDLYEHRTHTWINGRSDLDLHFSAQAASRVNIDAYGNVTSIEIGGRFFHAAKAPVTSKINLDQLRTEVKPQPGPSWVQPLTGSEYRTNLYQGMESIGHSQDFLRELENFGTVVKFGTEVGIGFVPVASTVQDAWNALSGRDIFGEEIGTMGRIFAGAGALLPFVSGTHLVKGSQAANRIIGHLKEVIEPGKPWQRISEYTVTTRHAAGGANVFSIVNPKYRRAVQEAFEDGPKAITLQDDLVVYRHWGGKSGETGSPWFSTKPYAKPGNAKRYLALPEGNTAQNVTAFRIPKGTTILRGKAASQRGTSGFGSSASGGGEQIYLPNPSSAIPE